MGEQLNLPQATTVPVTLLAGNNTITFGQSWNLRADLDRIVISGESRRSAPDFTTYGRRRHKSAARPASADAVSASVEPT